ncbi:MAG: DUF3379 family protein [Pseudoalteromonas sp.]|uniref:DUF3379 family protein n=1 Tax=unclassified Pseudoalteromonas TaxID=194690 RepID=UPI003F9822AD
MDELEFRRRVIAQPNSTEKELIAFAEQHPEQQKFVDDMQTFDEQLNAALDVDVPQGLAERVIANTANNSSEQQAEESKNNSNEHIKQSTKDNVVNAKKRFKKGRIQLAMAASLIVTVGAFFLSSQQHNTSHTVSEHALAHVYHEIFSLEKKEPISLQSVNEKFALLGGHLDELPGKVTYLMFCDFKGERGLHLVFESEFGPMTVFIVPSEHQSFGIGNDDFSDERFAGNINRGTQADTILIASLGAPIDNYNNRITDAIRWLH